MTTFKRATRVILPDDTMVIFQTNPDDVERLAKALDSMRASFQRRGIVAIACPNNITLTVIPRGTDPESIQTTEGAPDGN